MIFQIVSILFFILLAFWLYRVTRKSNEPRIIPLLKEMSDVDTKGIKELQHKGFFDIILGLKRPLYFITFALFLVLGVSGFVPVVFFGQHLGGPLMIIHLTAAPFFTVCLALLAIITSYEHRLTAADWNWVTAEMMKPKKERVTFAEGHLFWRKVFYWLIILASLPAILSIILMMYPLFGTEGQEYLLHVHQYSVLGMTILVTLHTYLLIKAHQQTITKKEVRLDTGNE